MNQLADKNITRKTDEFFQMAPKKSHDILQKMILDNGLLTADQLQIALIEARETKSPLDATLLKLGFLTSHSLTDRTAHPFTDTAPFPLGVHHILSQAITSEDPTSHTVSLFQAFLSTAMHAGASDIHFEPTAHFVRVRFRLDGILKEEVSFHKKFWPALCARIKILSTMNIAETRQPQTGRFSSTFQKREIDFRISSHPISHGENIVIRLLDRQHALLPLDHLGFDQSLTQRLKQCLQKPEGLFVVTGPTGAGKTTTLYSLLTHLNQVGVNIMTLEQPIEYELPLIRQTEIREDKGITFSDGIRSILRQDPDIIFIGEIRDPETAHMALRAAMTGHRVLTTLHTNSALGSIQRLMDLGVSPLLLSGNIMGLMAQRLVRRLCSHCKTQRFLTDHEKNHLHLPSEGSIEICEPVGCSECHQTGYKGRLPLAEFTDGADIFHHISDRENPRHLHKIAIQSGFQPLIVDAKRHLLAGHTSLAEILKAVDVDAQNVPL